MEAISVKEVRERRPLGLPSVVAYAGAAAFAVAAGWATLASHGVTVAGEPAPRHGVSVHQNQLVYLRWLMTTQPQERIYTAIAMIAFLALLATAAGVRDRFGGMVSAFAVPALSVGVVLWIAERAVHLGADQAVGLLTTHAYSTQTITGIGFTVDMITRALEITSFAIIGVGMAAFALGGRRVPSTPRVWPAWTGAIGAAMIAGSIATLTGNGTVDDVLVAIAGVILLPMWMWWGAAMLRA